MAEMIQLAMFTNEVIGLDKIIRRVHQLGYYVNIDQLLSLDDWNWSNTTSITLTDYLTRSWNPVEDKIFVCYFTINDTYRCFASEQWFNTNIFQTTVSLDTIKLPYLAKFNVNQSNLSFYDAITQEVIVLDSLVFATMGVEMSIFYEHDIISTLENSHFVNRIIIPHSRAEQFHLEMDEYHMRSFKQALIFDYNGE